MLFIKLKKILQYKFVKDSFFSLIATIILSISGIVLNIFIGNNYQASGLGVFNQALAAYLIISILTVLGLNGSVLKYVAEFTGKKETQKHIFSSALFMVIITSFLSLGIIKTLTAINPSLFFNAKVTKVLLTMLLSIPFMSVNKVFMGLVNALREMKVHAFIQSLRWVLIILFVLLSIYLKKSIHFLAYAFVFTEIILFIILFGKYHSFILLKRLKTSGWFRKNFVFGSKTVLLGFLSQTNNKLDIFFIGFFLSNYHVGVYSFASTIANGFLTLSSVVQLNINPIVSRLWAKRNIKGIQDYTTRIAKNMLVAMIPILIIAALIYPFFIDVFMNIPSYKDSITIFYILLLGIAIPAVYNFTASYYAMANFLNLSFYLLITRIIFNLIMCYIFIRAYGIYGAAIAIGLTNLMTFFLKIYFFKKKLGIKLLRIL